MRILLCFLGLLAGFSQAHANWVRVGTISETAVGKLCDVDANNLDLFCAGNHPEILADGSISATGLVVGGTPFSEAGPWQVSGTDVFRNSGNVGIGTATPQSVFHVNGDVAFSGDVLDVRDTPDTDFLIDAGEGKEVVFRVGEPGNAGAGTGDISYRVAGGGYPAITNVGGQGLHLIDSTYGSKLLLDDQGVRLNSEGGSSGTKGIKLRTINGDISLVQSNVGINPGGSSITPTTALEVIGTISATGLVVSGVSITDIGGADNLGNHTASQTLNLNGNWLSGDGDAEGLLIDGDGNAVFSGNISVTGSISTTSIQIGSISSTACAGVGNHGTMRINPSNGMPEFCREL